MKSWAGYWIVVVLVLGSGCSYEQAAKSTATTAKTNQAPPASERPAEAGSAARTDAGATGAAKEVTMPNGLIYEDLRVGQGAVAKAGMKATVHYTGWLTSGEKFDSSKDRGTPFSFTLGRGEVIRGWDEGVQGMLVGGKRKLTIPSALGYGANGYPGVIPPDAILVFDVELLDVQ